MTRSPTLAEEGDALSFSISGGLLVIAVVVNDSEADPVFDLFSVFIWSNETV